PGSGGWAGVRHFEIRLSAERA
ncbi:MAG: hypothetical protein QOG45_1614, partial [Chloroflexota bacterium]|nr:hypothetical protein [Chloroflexota bacterium]